MSCPLDGLPKEEDRVVYVPELDWLTDPQHTLNRTNEYPNTTFMVMRPDGTVRCSFGPLSDPEARHTKATVRNLLKHARDIIRKIDRLIEEEL